MNRRRFVESFRYAGHGLKTLWQLEQNVRIHVVITGMVIALGLWVGVSPIQWAVLALTIGAMLAVETLNTAIERAVDLTVGTTQHPVAKQAKDLSAAACLLMAFASIGVGIAIFGPVLFARFT